MANLGTYIIKANDYVNIETETGETLTQGDKYRIQSYDGDFWLREGADGKGDYVKSTNFVYYTHKGNDLFVRPCNGAISLNIATYTED